ncbi:MAG: hypothetical protein GX638_18310, partial [Crenarchaeota archaeon]|nr:hypothetical protein [Thermoproteota archaeon]
MKKIIRLSMFGLVLGLSLYVFEAPCWSAEEASPVEGLLRKDRTELNEFLWKELVARTQKGSLTIEKPDMSQLILQIANTWEAPFFDLEWVAKTDVMASETNETQYVSLECTNSTYTLRIGILKSMDAEAAMQRAVEYAVMRSESYNRGSSSSCEEPEGKGTLWIDIPGASFIASFIPIEGYPD